MPKQTYLEAGQVVGTHGVRGSCGSSLVRFPGGSGRLVHPISRQGRRTAGQNQGPCP